MTLRNHPPHKHLHGNAGLSGFNGVTMKQTEFSDDPIRHEACHSWGKAIWRAVRTGSLTLAATATLAMAVVCCPAAIKQPLTYVEILQHLTDLDRLATLQTGCNGGLYSSWDRRSTNHWGANGDAGHYLRVEPNGEAVMMELDGPGVVYRIWSANPVGKLRVYLDGAETPSFEWDFPDLFDGKLPPFIKPLVYRRDKAQSASNCYLPIPFAKHIKITADKAHAQYYHFNYVTFPQDQPVASFRLPLTTEEQTVLNRVAQAWSSPGRDPKPQWPNQRTTSRTLTLAPGQTAELFSIPDTGVIRAIRARVRSDQRYPWRKLVLRGVWDGAQWPQILTPLGPFFGFDWDTAEYASIPMGCRDEQAYQFFPMPFRQSATLSIQSFLEVPATVEFELQWAPAQLSENSVYFFARWRREPDLMRFDYPFIETAGRGHFVGVSMPIDHPLPGWWGEGDEMVWVDEDDFPRYIGTGSEDYFGDAWGIRYLSGPSYGASSMKGHRTCNYRWHFTDLIPFTKRMRMTIENYGPNGVGPRGQYDYSSTAFWYQAERTPPFEQLRGVKFTGGSDPQGKPVRMGYSEQVFPDLTAENLRTYGLALTFAQQAETLLTEEIKEHRGWIVTDATRPYEFDRERAVAFGKVAAGKSLAVFKVSVDAAGVYSPRIFTAPEPEIAALSLEVNGKPIGLMARPRSHELQLQGVFLTKGDHVMNLVAATAGEAVFDCLQLEPAARIAAAVEAEELTIVRTTGNATAPHPSHPISTASAGRVLEFTNARSGQGFVAKLGQRPALPYVLGIRPMLTPNAAIIQGFVDNEPIGPQFDLHSSKRQLGPSVLPLGPIPADATEVEIRVVGRNARSHGWEAAIDYLRWEPGILGPGSTEGVWMQVIAKHNCDYQGQDLGPHYSGGHHLWVMPCNLNAWIDIAIEIPKAGTYTIVTKYTKSWDYARIQTSLNSQHFGPEVDTYAPTVVPGDPVTLGEMHLSPGRHILRFQAVGHNPESKGFLMGIDHVIIR